MQLNITVVLNQMPVVVVGDRDIHTNTASTQEILSENVFCLLAVLLIGVNSYMAWLIELESN